MLFWSVGARWWACFGNSPPRQFGVTSLILMCRCSRWFGCPATEKDQLHSSVNGSAASDQRPPTFIAAIIPSFTDSTSRWRFHPSCHSVRLSGYFYSIFTCIRPGPIRTPSQCCAIPQYQQSAPFMQRWHLGRSTTYHSRITDRELVPPC